MGLLHNGHFIGTGFVVSVKSSGIWSLRMVSSLRQQILWNFKFKVMVFIANETW